MGLGSVGAKKMGGRAGRGGRTSSSLERVKARTETPMSLVMVMPEKTYKTEMD